MTNVERCDARCPAVALVWFSAPGDQETLAFCGAHAREHGLLLDVQCWRVICDNRPELIQMEETRLKRGSSRG